MLATAIIAVAAVARSAAQAPTGTGLYPSETVRDLPLSANLFALVETAQPEVVADRFNGGGLNVSDPSRLSAFLASWSQTQYRIGDISLSSPVDGTPMLFPEIAWWRAVEVRTGSMPVDSAATGLSLSLDPHRSGARWTGTVEAIGSGGAGTPAALNAPPIARLDDWTSLSALASGPLMNGRLGVSAGGSWTSGSRFERDDPDRLRQRTASAFAHATFAIDSNRELRTLAWLQSADHGRSTHIQATFARARRGGSSDPPASDPPASDPPGWRIFAGYTERSRRGGSLDPPDPTDPPAPPGVVDIERLTDGPVPIAIAGDSSRERRWALGARVAPSRQFKAHVIDAGGAVERTSAVPMPAFSGVVVERVNDVPARVWRYASVTLESDRHATAVTGFARDRISLSARATLEAAIRFESADAHARGAAGSITWRTWLPSVWLDWELGTSLHLRFITGVRRAANQPLLGLLAYGDPAAPVASVFRWGGSIDASTALVARVGPGTGGDPAFSAIDSHVKRPVTDEFAIGLESKPRPSLRLGVMGLARRESSLINAVNIGAPASSYTTFTVPDANADLVGASDDQLLVVYNRTPESFGQDRYVLTNPDQEAATMGAFVVAATVTTDRLFMQIGGTASASVGPGGNRGFRAFENDQDMVGELFANPNASTYARGRLFNDRAFTIKWTTVYRFPADIRAGVIARYQDGQPFSRMVVVPDLNQGAEAIQAFANGRSRFAFTGTVDARLQKGFKVGRARLDFILDVYNLLNMKKEVEEYVVTGPRFRETTAIQPPRAFHAGVRAVF